MASTTSPARTAIAFLCIAAAACPGTGPGDAGTDVDAGSDVDAGPPNVDAGPCDEPPGYVAGADCETPFARSEAVPCDGANPAPPCTPDDNAGVGGCDGDEDCPGGACIDNLDGCFCGAANCVTDADCPAGQACGCKDLPGLPRNACIPAECTTDVDCAGGACLLSGGNPDCCDPGDARGLFCTTADDECRTDAECAVGEACQLDVDGTRFVCSGPNCICG